MAAPFLLQPSAAGAVYLYPQQTPDSAHAAAFQIHSNALLFQRRPRTAVGFARHAAALAITVATSLAGVGELVLRIRLESQSGPRIMS